MQNKVALFLSFILIPSFQVFSQDYKMIEDLKSNADSAIEMAITNKEITGAMVTIVSSDSILLARGYGFHSDQKGRKVDPASSLFQVGSVGKVFTALMAKMYVDSGRLDPNIPIQNYIKDGLSSRTGFDSISLNHLLTHSAGLNDRVIGYAARKPEKRVKLVEHLKESLPGPYIRPGIEISYSNYSYGLAGYLVEKVSGMNFPDLVNKEVFRSLGMNSSGYDIKELNPDNLVKGYSPNKGELMPVESVFPHPIPAGSLITTGKDMAEFQKYYLQNFSAFNQGYEAYFQPNQFLSGYRYGYEHWLINEVQVYAKGGMVPGFTSLLILIPEKNLSIFLSMNTSSDQVIDDLAMEYWNIIFGITQVPVTHVSDFAKTDPALLTGSYRLNRLNRESIAEFFGQMRNTIEISNKLDTLIIFHDNDWHQYVETEPYIFSDVADKNQKMIFNLNKNKKIISLSRNNRIAGSYVPSTYEKIPWYDSNDFLNEWFGIFVLGSVMFIFYPIIWIIRIVIRKLRRSRARTYTYSGVLAFLFSLVVVIWIRKYFVYLLQNGNDLLFGFPEELRLYVNLPILMILLLVFGAVNTFSLRRSGLMKKLPMAIYAFQYLSSTIFLMVLYRWHFIGVNI